MKKSILIILFTALTLFLVTSLYAQVENQDSAKNQISQTTDSLEKEIDPQACDTDTAVANQAVAVEEYTLRENPLHL